MIIIPARIHSSRFPRKVLQMIDGIPMVVRCAKIAEKVNRTVVATDSEEVYDVCRNYGIEAVMTSPHHKSGTDRINEAVEQLKPDENEVVVNLQGDEPFIETETIIAVYERMRKALHEQESVFMVSCYKEIDSREADDPHRVKTVLDHDGCALYFSRSKIPFDRRGGLECYCGHIGIYGFSAKTLREFCALPHGELENIEGLEQLRAIQAGKTIAMVKVHSESFGIDTPEDLESALARFCQEGHC